MNQSPRVLIVEDEDIVRTLLSAHLQNAGYDTELAATYAETSAWLQRGGFDLVVLDLGLPDEDGLVILRQLRMKYDVPVLVLSGRNDPDTRHAALKLGADDYVHKSVQPEEIVLRVAAIMRRLHGSVGTLRTDSDEEVSFSGWCLQISNRMLLDPQGRDVQLTRAEFDILHTLVRANGRVLSRDHLMDGLAYSDEPPADRMIDSFISRIRRKMGTSRHIVTVTGVGYRFVETPP